MIFADNIDRHYIGAQTQIRLHDGQFSVWNDGGLPEGITEEDLRKVHRSKPRNPYIADVCFKGGYIDSWGRGTIKIIEACEEANLPEPVLKDEQGGFLSKIFKDWFTEEQLKKIGLSERQVKAIDFLKEIGSISNKEYQSLFDITDRTALRDLDNLVSRGLVYKKGEKKGTRYLLHHVG